MSDFIVTRRDAILLAGSTAALAMSGCTAAPLMGASAGGAISAVNALGRSLGLAIVGNELTKVVDSLCEQVRDFFVNKGGPSITHVSTETVVYCGDLKRANSNPYACAFRRWNGKQAVGDPTPFLFAANGDRMHLLPRAVLSIAAAGQKLVDMGVAPSAIHGLTLPLEGRLDAIENEASYPTTMGRLTVRYYPKRNIETVTIMGLPGRSVVSWEFPVDSLRA